MGGQKKLDDYENIRKRNGLGQRTNALRRAMSNAKLLGKALGGLGNLFGAIDAVSKAKDCHATYCR